MIKEKYSLLGCFMFSNFYASQSTILEADGYACKGYDKLRKQAEETADRVPAGRGPVRFGRDLVCP